VYQLLKESSGSIIAIIVSDGISGEDLREINHALRGAISRYGKIRLLVEIEGFRHLEPDALLEKLRFARDHAQDIERMAVVSSRVWIKSWVKVGGLAVHADVEYFDRSEIEAAWTWIRRG
jgi:hypothetical protein